ncbi:transferase [Leptolyngbya valderiana BDU 20041]|nr:transferase [Leptolyngbya valderiana BDU 20041]
MDTMPNTIAATAVIHPHVRLGENVTIEDFCIIGVPFKGYQGEPTVIGDNAVIRSHTVIYAGNRIGNGFQSGHKANLRELNIIGDDVSIGTLSVIEHRVTIGDGVRIHTQAFIPEFSILEDCCWVGPNVVLTNAKFPQHPNAKAELKAPHIEQQARIGANSTLLPGVRVGKRSLVGAGSLVTHSVPPGVIFAGSPAKYLRDVDY